MSTQSSALLQSTDVQHSQFPSFSDGEKASLVQMVADLVRQEMQDQMRALQEENLELQDQLRRLASFNPNEHLMKIGSGTNAKDYLQVQWRLVWFRLAYPHGSIETEEIYHDPDRETEEEGYAWNQETRRSEKVTKRGRGYAIFKATVKDGKGGVATGYKSEKAASFPDYYEKSETGSIGRALAALGYGTQFTGDEFDERHRIVDSPVDRGARAKRAAGSASSGEENGIAASSEERRDTGTPSPQQPITAGSGKITEAQRKSLLNLYSQLGEDVPDLNAMTEAQARIEIPRLNTRLREKKQGARPVVGSH